MNNVRVVEIRKAVAGDRDALAETLAQAFVDDPVWTWMIPRHEGKRRLFAALLRHAIPKGNVYTTGGRDAVIMWSPPGDWKLPASAMVRAAPPMVRAAGLGLPRLLGRLGAIERLHEKVPGIHWYLEFIGVSKNAQGMGLGSALLEHGLNHGLPAYLESSNPRNLTFYKRHGFEVTGEPQFKAGPAQWTLWREPGNR